MKLGLVTGNIIEFPTVQNNNHEDNDSGNNSNDLDNVRIRSNNQKTNRSGRIQVRSSKRTASMAQNIKANT